MKIGTQQLENQELQLTNIQDAALNHTKSSDETQRSHVAASQHQSRSVQKKKKSFSKRAQHHARPPSRPTSEEHANEAPTGKFSLLFLFIFFIEDNV